MKHKKAHLIMNSSQNINNFNKYGLKGWKLAKLLLGFAFSRCATGDNKRTYF